MNNHFADVGKKDGMSLTLALIVLDRLNTSERIDVARDNLAEAVRVVSAAAKKQVPQKLIVTTSTKRCPSCNKQLTNKGCIHSKYNYCKWCGQALDWTN